MPENYNVMGSIGAAILAKEAVEKRGYSNFKGFDIYDRDFQSRS